MSTQTWAANTTAKTSAAPLDGSETIRVIDGGVSKKALVSDVARIKLQAALTLYVRTDGSDSNDGLANTAGGAFLTLTQAWKTLCRKYDLNGWAVTIQLADGTYSGVSGYGNTDGEDSSWLNGYVPVGASFVTIKGNASDRTAVVLNWSTLSAWTAINFEQAMGGILQVRDLTIDAQAQNGTSPVLLYGSNSYLFQNVKFQNPGATGSRYCVEVGANSYVSLGNCTVVGNWSGLIRSYRNANVALWGASWTITGTPAWGTAFIHATKMSYVESTATFTGSATGKRYEVDTSAYVKPGTGGATHFPGDTVGTVSLGGVYDGIKHNTVTKTAAYTATNADDTIRCDATSAAFTVTLPAAATYPGKVLRIKKVDSSANVVTIDGNSSETIDGATTKSLGSQYDSYTIQSNGTDWDII